MRSYCRSIGLSLLLILALKIVQPAESSVLKNRENDKTAAADAGGNQNHQATPTLAMTLESAMSKIQLALQTEREQQRQEDDNNDFSRRPRNVDELKQIVADLRAAQQQEQEDTKSAVEHLQNFVSGMHSFMKQNQQEHGRHLNAPISGELFQAAAFDLAMAGENDSLMPLQQNVATIQQGLYEAMDKLYNALQDMSKEKVQGVAEHLVQVREEYQQSNLDRNPIMAMSVASKAIGRLLDRDTSEDEVEDIALEDVLALIWIMPISIVAGTFFWAFAGLDTYRDFMTPFQIWIFEIAWVSKIIGCAIDNDFVCTAADAESSESRLPQPSLQFNNKEEGAF